MLTISGFKLMSPELTTFRTRSLRSVADAVMPKGAVRDDPQHGVTYLLTGAELEVVLNVVVDSALRSAKSVDHPLAGATATTGG